MAERSAGWRQGPDGQWSPPIGDPTQRAKVNRDQLAELADLVNSGALAAEINDVVDDPDFSV